MVAGPTRWRRVAAGVYESEDGQHRLIRTEAWEGPRGGNLGRWEHAEPGLYGGWDIDGSIFETTLRAAKAEFERTA